MGNGKLGGGGLVLIRRDGGRWRADVFVRRASGGTRLAAQVRGSLACVQLIATKGAPLLEQPNGQDLFVEFLSNNRCRITGPVAARAAPFPADQPPDADLELLRNANELNG